MFYATCYKIQAYPINGRHNAANVLNIHLPIQNITMKNETNHGGIRPNSGRPATRQNCKAVTVSIDKEMIERIRKKYGSMQKWADAVAKV
jgi:hypothetical protein